MQTRYASEPVDSSAARVGRKSHVFGEVIGAAIEKARIAAAGAEPLMFFASSDFLYAFTKEKARGEAVDRARRAGAGWRRVKREGNRAFKKCVPEWKPAPEPLPAIDRLALSWWKNRTA